MPSSFSQVMWFRSNYLTSMDQSESFCKTSVIREKNKHELTLSLVWEAIKCETRTLWDCSFCETMWNWCSEVGAEECTKERKTEKRKRDRKTIILAPPLNLLYCGYPIFPLRWKYTVVSWCVKNNSFCFWFLKR